MKTKLLFTAFALGASLSAFSQWTTQAIVPFMEGQAAAVAHPNGNIYLIGGYTGSTALDSVFSFTQASNVWNHETKLPYATRGAAVTMGNDSMIYCFGGYDGSNDLDSAYKYNPTTKVWTRLTPMPHEAWYGTAATAPNGKMIVFGGEDASGFTNYVQIYDPVGNSWTAGANVPVAQIIGAEAVAAKNGKIYLIGGSDGNNPLDSVQIYDPVGNSWSRGAHMPTPRCQFATGLDENGHINCTGGKTNTGNSSTPFYNNYEIYNPNMNSWTTGPALPQGLGETTGAFINNGINVLEGVDSTNGYDNPNYRLNIISNSVPEVNVTENLAIYPNPTNGPVNLWISSSAEENAKVTIMSITGQVVYNETWTNLVSGVNKTVDMTGLSKGLYFVRFDFSKSSLVKKIVLE